MIVVVGVGMDLPENVDRESKPTRVCYRGHSGAVSETANRACNSTVWKEVRGEIVILITLLAHMIPIKKIMLTPSFRFSGSCS